LTYLSGASVTSPDCGETIGGKLQHEALGLKTTVDTGTLSDLSYPSTNARSGSTVYRGVGVRITSADRIKCTQICPNPSGPPTYTAFHVPGYVIPLGAGGKINPTDIVPPNCQVMCAADYYPPGNAPVAGVTDSRELIQPLVKTELASLVPPPFLYDPEAGFSSFNAGVTKAAVYKTSELAYELMNVDNKGCASSSGNSGNQRMIPYTVIFPNWVYINDDFTNNGMVPFFKNLAPTKFPFSLQPESPLAGLAPTDPLLTIGLHFNY
jgi:hypothetical protein